ncbi:hypothetical protein W97_02101 [Coniosporium apollinis CBS 100218]|uniref:Uncharacterized protein n=1 Tax=Coniosporium apollinis (strain CBS 100218) TaxID=1168221 RepID=R7YMJ1_CONA1|nr:uncharacterized protein W97_02101 [Coniosporium apollinis CBS 100218]EON62876.1 hypothetical protein W97_02101 [Coniosporium apollinis CBS 100218]
MNKFWDEATFLLEVLFLKLIGQDKDGIDLSFTESKVAVSCTKRESNLRKAMERARPKYQQSVLETDMHAALKGIFDQIVIKGRPVSIEFVQFGDDEIAVGRLRHLDNDVVLYGIEDMIDHEIFAVQGDIHKVLLGSFVESYDRLDETEEQDRDSLVSRRTWPPFQQPQIGSMSESPGHQDPRESFGVYPRSAGRRDSEATVMPPRGQNAERNSWWDRSHR